MSQQINLYNPLFIKNDNHFSLLAMAQGLGVILVGSLLFFAYGEYQMWQLEKFARAKTAEFTAKKAELDKLSAQFSPQQANELLQNEVQQLEKKSSEKTELVATLRQGAVGNTSGYSEYMRAFSRQVLPGLWLTGFKLTGDATQMSLSGSTTNAELVPTYIQKLGRESIMQGKNFSNLQMQQPKPDAKAGDKAASARYVEFTLHSTPDKEVKP